MFSGIRKPGAVLTILVVLLCAAFYYSSRLRFDYDFEKFFPDNDPALPFFHEHRNTFGFDNEFILVAVENKGGIFRQDFLRKIDHLSTRLRQLKLVDRVMSPTNLKKTSAEALGLMQTPLLHFKDTSLYRDDSTFIYNSAQWKNTFFAADGKSLCLYIQSQEGISKNKSDSLANAIKACVHAENFDESHFAGRIFAQAVYLDKLREQFLIFLLTSFVLISALLWITFKRVGAVLLPLSVVFFSLLLTFGIMGMTGHTIDIMAVMIPSMVFVAGMSDVVHFYTKYAEEMNRRRLGQQEIFRMIFKEVAGPTFLTLLSTVAGFLSLCYSGVKPIRDFGIFTSVGITVAFVLTYTYLPAMLMIFPVRKTNESQHDSSLDRMMQRLFGWVIRNGKIVSFATCLLVVISVWGMTKLEKNQSILEDLPKNERVKQDLVFFEKYYGGVRPLEIAVQVVKPGKTVWDRDILSQLDKVENFVAKTYTPGFLLSPASLVKSVNDAYDGEYVIPSDSAEFFRDVKALTSNRHSRQLRSLVTVDGSRARYTAKMRDAGSREMEKYDAALTHFIRTNTDSTALKFTITGTANLIDINNKNLITNTLQGLLTGVGILGLLTLILHRSIKMVFVFLIPNLVPLVIMAGIMGLCGIELKSSTAIFFSIAFGIATDDTIHFISRFRLELKAGRSPLRAFRLTYFETGKAVLLTTLVLLGGFVSLISSDFQSIYLFGLLTAITLLVALLSEIFLLPVLLTFLFRIKK